MKKDLYEALIEYPKECYHFYFDEGGLLGIPKISLLKDRRRKNQKDVYFYYIGYMEITSIVRYLEFFSAIFRLYIYEDDKSCVKITKKSQDYLKQFADNHKLKNMYEE